MVKVGAKIIKVHKIEKMSVLTFLTIANDRMVKSRSGFLKKGEQNSAQDRYD